MISTVTNPMTTGATAGALPRAAVLGHPYAAAASRTAAPVMSGVRLREEIHGAAFGIAPAVAGAELAGAIANPKPVVDGGTAQLRASVRWSDDL